MASEFYISAALLLCVARRSLDLANAQPTVKPVTIGEGECARKVKSCLECSYTYQPDSADMDSAVENGEDNDCLLANDVKKAGRRERYTRACNQVENCFCRVERACSQSDKCRVPVKVKGYQFDISERSVCCNSSADCNTWDILTLTNMLNPNGAHTPPLTPPLMWFSLICAVIVNCLLYS